MADFEPGAAGDLEPAAAPSPPSSIGCIVGIALRPARRAPMQLVDSVSITAGAGLQCDHKGLKFPNRGLTIMTCEDWAAALADLAAGTVAPVPGSLPWTVRRANMLVSGLVLPRKTGTILRIADVELEVTAQTYPCRRMDEARPGLLKALGRQWRGGLTCRVLAGGTVALGDSLIVSSGPDRQRQQ